MGDPRDEKGRPQTTKRPEVVLLEKAQRNLEHIKSRVTSCPEYGEIFQAHKELHLLLTRPVTPGTARKKEEPPPADAPKS